MLVKTLLIALVSFIGFPETMASAVPRMPPAVISGGSAAPMVTLPMKASSSVAPTARPAFTSPAAGFCISLINMRLKATPPA